jgi:hypothetical protein
LVGILKCPVQDSLAYHICVRVCVCVYVCKCMFVCTCARMCIQVLRFKTQSLGRWVKWRAKKTALRLFSVLICCREGWRLSQG